ncbi:MAG: 4-alpha-glucanotransferase [bacterium]|nr:4-alpha-glucanotransferase [bacterium]
MIYRVTDRVKRRRAAGILVHPGSLWGPHGIGDVGPVGAALLDWTCEAGLRVWQVLPLGPTPVDGSPYSSPSAFAGNPWLISPRELELAGWIPAAALDSAPGGDSARIDFGAVIEWKSRLLRRAWDGFRRNATEAQRDALSGFVSDRRHAAWLEDWALFAALKARHGGQAWTAWPDDLRRRSPDALSRARRELGDEMAFHRFVQWLFECQWTRLREEAGARGIELFGDLPFYVAGDSADVWAHPDLFRLGDDGSPDKIAGVPPDYFSEDGQLWGNPVFDWDRSRETGHAWWHARLRHNLGRFDRLRLDHFRGYSAFWQVDAGAETAAGGSWQPGPGHELFESLGEGSLPPLVAEDLGVISDDVVALRERIGLPGTRVLQFGFDDPGGGHHPSSVPENAVAYTGTHDNDTTRGWFSSLTPELRERVLHELGGDGSDVTWRMIESCLGCSAELAVVPAQDFLDLGSEARLNRPGVAQGNWAWRLDDGMLTLKLASRVRRLVEASGRV